MYVPAACDCCQFGKGAFEKDVFLIVDDVNSRPIHRDDDVVLGQTWSREFVRFVETREEKWPLVLGKNDDVFLDSLRLDRTLSGKALKRIKYNKKIID